MSAPNNLPLKLSRILVTVGSALCAIFAILLLVLGILLLIVWPEIVSQTASLKVNGTEVPLLESSRPWASVALIGGAVILGLAAEVLRRLMEILNSVAAGNAFTAENTAHLIRIGWLMIALEIAGFLTGFVGHTVSPGNDGTESFGISFGGVLAALLTFVLAQVFEQARRMRDDLEGTN